VRGQACSAHLQLLLVQAPRSVGVNLAEEAPQLVRVGQRLLDGAGYANAVLLHPLNGYCELPAPPVPGTLSICGTRHLRTLVPLLHNARAVLRTGMQLRDVVSLHVVHLDR